MIRSWAFALAAALLLLLGAVQAAAAATTCPSVPTGLSNVAPVSPLFTYGDYAKFGAQYGPANLGTLGFPGGLAGKASAFEQRVDFALPAAPRALQNAKRNKAMEASCPGGACITTLQSFAGVYAALPAKLQPALANYAFSDATFARMRLTGAPMLITAVPTMGDLPISPASINGLTSIIASTGGWMGGWVLHCTCTWRCTRACRQC